MVSIRLIGAFSMGLALATACSEPPKSALNTEIEAPVSVVPGTATSAELLDMGDGRWRVDFSFAEPQTAMIFSRSLGDYRTDTWTAREDSPPVQRIGGFDAIIFDEPTRSASYVLTPYTGDIQGDYNPWLAFGDGSLALYTGQFELLAIDGADDIEALDDNLANWTGEQGEQAVRVISGRQMLLDGEIHKGEVLSLSRGEGDYVLIGDAPLEEGASYVGVIDSTLPSVIADSLDADLDAIFKGYEAAFGYGLPTKATLYFAFGGFEHPGYSFSGSVIGSDLIVMRASGSLLKDYPPQIRQHILWFFAHEAAHVFQGEGGAMPGLGENSWIHEGSANTMATTIITAIGAADERYRFDELDREIDECAAGLAEGPLNSLSGQVHYACGDLIFTMADATLDEVSVFDIWKAIQDEMKSTGSSDLTAELVVSTFKKLGVGPDTLEHLRTLVSTPVSDPEGFLLEALETSGITFETDEDGNRTGFSSF